MIEDITGNINIFSRKVKDVDYKCPKCEEHITLCDVGTGRYVTNKCYNCGYEVKFFVNDLMNREFVCVSQGMVILRTQSQENAINFVKESNDKWFDYVQKCKDNYEDYADNYVELYIEE